MDEQVDAVVAGKTGSSRHAPGGGAAGVETAQARARCRCAVTVIEEQDRLLSREEPEAEEPEAGEPVAGEPVAEGLWAVGGITGRGTPTRVPAYRAKTAVRGVLGRSGPGAGHRALLRAAFTDPGIAAVGFTGRQTRGRGSRGATRVLPPASSTRGRLHGPGGEGSIEPAEDTGRGVPTGAAPAGPADGEVPYGLNAAVHAEEPAVRLRYVICTPPALHRAAGAALGGLR
ncbi:NAD-binding protein [Streptomyces nitrosporeus]|uniref:NAD-binding protein n=1 Tax=Streptomyces nitrosporeus TaxID=28894 RepID=UPI00399FE99B